MVAYDQRQSKLEIAQVDAVHWHKTANDKDWNVSDIVSRDRRTKAHDPDFSYVRHRVPCIQGDGAKFSGHPVNPRRGNAVKALFYKNQKPIILGPVDSKFEPPVCRPTPYDERHKFSQYRPLAQDEDKDFVTDFPDPKKPQCRTLFHGPCLGSSADDGKEPCLGRDYMHVFDFCQEGDKDPSCEKCVDIDFPKRCKNSWHKHYSRSTESCQSPNGRDEWKLYNGSFRRAEAETGPSDVYSEGKGHIREQNAVSDQDLRGHINWKGDVAGGCGTIDVHAEDEQVAFASENKGARMSVVNNLDGSVTFAYEAIYFDQSAYIRIMKDGQIMISTPKKITIESTGDEVLIKAKTKITLDSPLTHNTANVQTDGTCVHVGCSCPCCGGN